MDVRARVNRVLDAEPNETQMDKFLTEVRDSLATSGKLFVGYSFLVLTTLVTYHVVVYLGGSGVRVNSVQISDPLLFQRVFLMVPAALLAAKASVGYLRRCQREVYDYLMISRYRVLGESGLHELRLPADYILGLFILKNEGGKLGNALASTVAFLSVCVFVFVPAIYIVGAAILNVMFFGAGDVLCFVASFTAAALALCSLVIVGFATRIKAE